LKTGSSPDTLPLFMFLKRSLVLIVGVLLFIAVFLFKIHHSDAKIENEFQQARVQHSVDQTVLTAPESAPPATPAPATVTPASTASAPAPAPATDSTPPPPPASTADSSSTAPGSTTDTNVIIGPVPPSSDATAPQAAPMAPTPDTNATPSLDTNSGPMAPLPPTTMVEPRRDENRSPFLVPASYDPAETALHMAGEETAQSTMPAQAAPVTNVAPAAPPTNTPVAATTKTSANTVTTATNVAPATTGPGRPMPVESSIIILGYHQFTGPGVPSKNPYSMSQDVF
jgi:hypothetical protein